MAFTVCEGFSQIIQILSSLPGYKTEADTELQSTVWPHFYTHIWHTDSGASPPHPETLGLHRYRVLEGQRNKNYSGDWTCWSHGGLQVCADQCNHTGPVWRRGPQAWGLAYCCNYISYLHSSEFCKWSPMRPRSMCWGLGPQFICGPTCHCLLVFLGWVLSPSQTCTHWTLPASKSQRALSGGARECMCPRQQLQGDSVGDPSQASIPMPEDVWH